jgi:hypothetical protein
LTSTSRPIRRGRSERVFGTLQDRLINGLAKAGIREIKAANAWIRDVYLPAHNAAILNMNEMWRPRGCNFIVSTPPRIRKLVALSQ